MENTYNRSYNYNTTTTVDAKSATRNMYGWMTMALIISGLAAMATMEIATSNVAFFNFIFGGGYWVLAIAEIALVFILSARIEKQTVATSTILFIVYSLLNGMTLAPIFAIYTSSSIASTFFITAGTFGAMSLYGFVTKKDLSSMGKYLTMAVIGIVIAIVVNMFLHNSLMQLIISGVAVIVFTGLTAYDTQKFKQLIEAHSNDGGDITRKIALIGALSLYLDFVNLFIHLLSILGDRK